MIDWLSVKEFEEQLDLNTFNKTIQRISGRTPAPNKELFEVRHVDVSWEYLDKSWRWFGCTQAVFFYIDIISERKTGLDRFQFNMCFQNFNSTSYEKLVLFHPLLSMLGKTEVTFISSHETSFGVVRLKSHGISENICFSSNKCECVEIIESLRTFFEDRSSLTVESFVGKKD